MRLLLAEQEDDVLARRINDARILKEKVQLAYLEFYQDSSQNKTFKCSEFIKQNRALVAGIVLLVTTAVLLIPSFYTNDALIHAKQLMNNTQPLKVGAIADAIGKHRQVVIHVSQYDEEKFSSVIDEIEALLYRHDADKSLSIEVVANRQGLKVLDVDDSKFAHRLDQLTKQFGTLKVVACARSLALLASKGDPVNLMKSILTTPSADQQVARRTSEGWIYIKV